MNDLEDRVRRLESQNRWFKGVGCAAIIVAVGLLILGRATPTNTRAKERIVKAQVFVVVDEDEKVRGIWGTSPDNTTSLTLGDQHGQTRVRWEVLPDGTMGLTLSDKNGKNRGAWGVTSDGTTQLTLLDKNGKTRGTWNVLPDGTAVLSLLDGEGKAIFAAP